MRITKISVYRKVLTYARGAYAWGRGNVIESGLSTIVTIDTDAGLSGAGEFCPCGDNYMVAHREGTEATARLLAPALLGEDPRQVGRIERRMDNTVQGHGYAKAPFDAACWDILGKATGQPVWMLLGGKLTDGAPLYRPAPQKAPEEMAIELELLRSDGYLFLNTPNEAGLLKVLAALCYKGSFGMVRYPVQKLYHIYHLFYFTERNMPQLLSRAGFDTIQVRKSLIPIVKARGSRLEKGVVWTLSWFERLLGMEYQLSVIARKA